MTLPAKLKDVVDAFDQVGDELSHYMDKRSGEILLVTVEEMSAAEEDEPLSDYPEWQRESLLLSWANPPIPQIQLVVCVICVICG
jgi:hypothetical protein